MVSHVVFWPERNQVELTEGHLGRNRKIGWDEISR